MYLKSAASYSLPAWLWGIIHDQDFCNWQVVEWIPLHSSWNWTLKKLRFPLSCRPINVGSHKINVATTIPQMNQSAQMKIYPFHITEGSSRSAFKCSGHSALMPIFLLALCLICEVGRRSSVDCYSLIINMKFYCLKSLSSAHYKCSKST